MHEKLERLGEDGRKITPRFIWGSLWLQWKYQGQWLRKTSTGNKTKDSPGALREWKVDNPVSKTKECPNDVWLCDTTFNPSTQDVEAGGSL